MSFGFGTGLSIGLIIDVVVLILCLLMVSSGKINKEEEAYRNGYEDGLKANKNKGEYVKYEI